MTTFQELTGEDVNVILEAACIFPFRRYASGRCANRKLSRLKQAIQKYESELTQALYQDLGKSEFESYTTEIDLC